jgi:hypothetical protein
MPTTRSVNASVYDERLSLPWYWWLVALGIVAAGTAEVAAGFTWDVALGVFAALGLPTAALLTVMGRGRVRVDAAGVHAGGRTLDYDEIDTLESLDARETRLRIGPAADPSAHLVTRGWIHSSVLIRPLDTATTPYWLVCSRRPHELIEAVTRHARR